MAAGADHYLLKPFVPDEVLRHVARVLDLAI
jgi:DNA-binding response OmpR family regulator